MLVRTFSDVVTNTTNFAKSASLLSKYFKAFFR